MPANTLYSVAIYSKRTGCGWFNNVLQDFELWSEMGFEAAKYVDLYNRSNEKYGIAKIIPADFDSLIKFIRAKGK